jgi:hypothetical protein
MEDTAIQPKEEVYTREVVTMFLLEQQEVMVLRRNQGMRLTVVVPHTLRRLPERVMLGHRKNSNISIHKYRPSESPLVTRFVT